MATALPIITGADNPLLRAKAKKITALTKDLKKLIERMQVTVRKADGIGLAAPQVAESVRLIIARISGTFLPMLNPEVLEFSAETEIFEEGCLSLPGIWGMVRRPRAITLRFQDERGIEKVLYLIGMDARVVQHEVDHLDGILFLDRVSAEAETLPEEPALSRKA